MTILIFSYLAEDIFQTSFHGSHFADIPVILATNIENLFLNFSSPLTLDFKMMRSGGNDVFQFRNQCQFVVDIFVFSALNTNLQ